MDQKRSREDDTPESRKVHKVDKSERNEGNREFLSVADLDMNNMDAIIEKLDSIRDSRLAPPSWDQLREIWEIGTMGHVPKEKGIEEGRNKGKCIYVQYV